MTDQMARLQQEAGETYPIIAINGAPVGHEARRAFIAGRTISKDADEDLREKISEVVLADSGYAGSDYHPDVVTNIADAVYEHLGLVIEE